MTTRRQFLAIGASALLAAPGRALGQSDDRVWRVGFLWARSRMEPPLKDYYDEVPKHLRDLGYVEGKNLVIERRYANGSYERLPELAHELVRLKVDVIVTEGTPGIRAAQGATQLIPIVFFGGSDLVASGLVKSLSRPGGNTTGITLLLPDTIGKQLELLRGMVPGLSRIAVLFSSGNNAHPALLDAFRSVAQATGAQVLPVGARTGIEIESAMSSAVNQRAQALVWIPDSFLIAQRSQIAELSLRHRLPSMSAHAVYAEVGGLMCYGPNVPEGWKRVARFVDQIFKGANPGNLPVEQPTKLELVLNRKTATALGLTIPPELLLLADRVIE